MEKMTKLFHGIVQKVLDFGPFLVYNGTINIEKQLIIL